MQAEQMIGIRQESGYSGAKLGCGLLAGRQCEMEHPRCGYAAG